MPDVCCAKCGVEEVGCNVHLVGVWMKALDEHLIVRPGEWRHLIATERLKGVMLPLQQWRRGRGPS